MATHKDNTTTIGLLILLGVAGFMIYRKRKQLSKGGSKLDISNLQTKTDENTPVNIDLEKSDKGNSVSNFFNVTGSITYVLTKNPDNGTAQINGNVLTYTPSQNFFGVDTMKYVKQDDSGQTSNEATITVTVTAVYDGTQAQDINITTAEDTPLTYDLGSGSAGATVSTGRGSTGATVSTGRGSAGATSTQNNAIQQTTETASTSTTQRQQPTRQLGFDGSFTKTNSNRVLDFNADY